MKYALTLSEDLNTSRALKLCPSPKIDVVPPTHPSTCTHAHICTHWCILFCSNHIFLRYLASVFMHLHSLPVGTYLLTVPGESQE